MNQTFYKSKLPLFCVFHGSHEFNFLKNIFMLIKQHYGFFIFFIKFHLLIGINTSNSI